MSGIRISSRYAKSLLDLSIEKGEVDNAFADMQLAKKAISESRDFRLMLANPVIKTDKKVAILKMIFDGKLSPIAHSFVLLLARKGREGLMSEVADSFILQTKAYKQITTVELISAVKLDDATRNKAIEAAMQMAKGKVELIEVIDPELIGGFILRVADTEIDTSLSGKFRQLRRDFSENLYMEKMR